MSGMVDGVNKVFLVQHRDNSMHIDAFESERAMVEAKIFNAGYQASGFDGEKQIAWIESLKARIDEAIAIHRDRL